MNQDPYQNDSFGSSRRNRSKQNSRSNSNSSSKKDVQNELELPGWDDKPKQLQKGLLDGYDEENGVESQPLNPINDVDDDELTYIGIVKELFPELVYKDKKTGEMKIDKNKLDISFIEKLSFDGSKKNHTRDKSIDKDGKYLLQLERRASSLEIDALADHSLEEKAQNGLSYTKMLKHVNENHPRQDVTDRQGRTTKQQFPMDIPLGMNVYGISMKESALLEYGIGITLYFKYLKYLIGLFFIMFAINIPVTLMLLSTDNKITNYYTISRFSEALFQLTYGVVGENRGICSGSDYYLKDGKEYYEVNLACPLEMTIYEFATIVFEEESSCVTDSESMLKFTDSSYSDCKKSLVYQTGLATNCVGQNVCDYEFLVDELPQSCKPFYTNATIKHLRPTVYAVCESFAATFQGGKSDDKREIYNAMIQTDILCLIVFLGGQMLVYVGQKKDTEKYNTQTLSPQKYTIRVEGFKGYILNLYSYLEDLLRHFEKYFDEFGDLGVMDVNYVLEQNSIIKQRFKIGSIVKKINALEFLIDRAEKASNQIQQRFVSKLYEKHLDYEKELKAVKKELEEIEIGQYLKLKYVYITFNSPLVASAIIKKYRESAVSRLMGINKEPFRFFNNLKIKVKRAKPPSNIQWNNIGTSNFRLGVRKYFFHLVQLIFILGGFYFLMYLQIEKVNYMKLFTPLKCTKDYTIDDVVASWDNKSILKCYCENKFTGTMKEDLKNSKDSFFAYDKFTCPNTQEARSDDPFYYYQAHSACYDYFEAVDHFNGTFNWIKLQFGMSLAIAIANGTTALIVTLISKLKKRPTVSSELRQTTMGVFLMQTLNMGFLMFLAELDGFQKMWGYFTPPSSKLFYPMCNDYSVEFNGKSIFGMEWFLRNGTTLIVTVFLSAFTYQFVTLLLYALFQLYRWWDRGFTQNKKKTRKLMQYQYNKVYRGPKMPLDNSYSTILTFMFVVLMYTTGIPILYLLAGFALTLLFWVDKFLVLRFYSNPLRLYHKFNSKIQNLIPYVLLLHLAFAILIYGSFDLAPPDESNYYFYFQNYVQNNQTQPGETDIHVSSFVSDIGLFYRKTLEMPYISFFGYCLIITFLGILIRLIIYLPFKNIFKDKIDKIFSYTRFWGRKDTMITEEFATVIDDSRLLEKIKFMRKQRDMHKMTVSFKKRFDRSLEIYSDELKARKNAPRLGKFIKGNPFYGMEFTEDYKAKFGLIYSQRLHHKHQLNSE